MSWEVQEEIPFISVIIPVRNEEKFIRRTLQYILQQEYPRDKLEIIVVDGKSIDETGIVVNDIIKEDDRVRLLENPKKLSSAARNIGAKEARGDIVTFIDGHVYIDNDLLLKNTAFLMSKHDISVLSRPQFLDTPDNSFFQKAVAYARRSILGHGLDSTIYSEEKTLVDPTSSGATYKKELFEKVGYFDENFDAAEDVDFNFRVGKAGYKSLTAPELTVHYYPRGNAEALFRQMTRYGIGRFRILKKHGYGISSGALLLAAFYCIVALLLILSPFSRFLFKTAAKIIGLYLVIVLLASLNIAVKRGMEYMKSLPLIFLTIHSGLAWGFVKEAFRSFKRGGTRAGHS